MADLGDDDYRRLAGFRHEIRRFLRWSETAAAAQGLTAQQYQALLAIRAAPPDAPTVGWLAEQLLVRAHSASELVDRLSERGLLLREPAADDRRQVRLRLTGEALALLASLAAVHREELHRRGPLIAGLLQASEFLRRPARRCGASEHLRRKGARRG